MPPSFIPEIAVRFLLLKLVCLIILSFSAMAQSTEPTEPLPSVTLPAELERVLRDYEQAWEARDAKALAGLFAPDGFVLQRAHPPTRGRAAIEKAYQGSGGPLYLRALAFEQSDAIAYIIGEYRFHPDQPDIGKFILTLQKDSDGRWLITADMDNSNG